MVCNILYNGIARSVNGTRPSRVSPAICKAPVLVVVPKRVPEAEGHADVVDHVPGALQYLTGITRRNSAAGRRLRRLA